MLAVVVSRQAAKAGAVGVYDADLILCLHLEYLADEYDFAGRFVRGRGEGRVN
jgi:hypothetical protein